MQGLSEKGASGKTVGYSTADEDLRRDLVQNAPGSSGNAGQLALVPRDCPNNGGLQLVAVDTKLISIHTEHYVG
jgi:hypothetical protein